MRFPLPSTRGCANEPAPPPFLLLFLVFLGVAAAPVVAPNSPATAFNTLLNAPPPRVYLRDTAGAWRAPFIYP